MVRENVSKESRQLCKIMILQGMPLPLVVALRVIFANDLLQEGYSKFDFYDFLTP